MLAVLTSQVKRKCNITWEDEDTNARVDDIIKSAIPRLIHRLGITDSNFDFSAAGTENTIFLAYCFYEWNHALDEFDANYSQLIAETRDRHEVERYLESEEAESEEEI